MTHRLRAVVLAALFPGMAFGQLYAQQQAPPPERPMPPVLKNYQPVTAARLKNPDARDWLMIRRTYDGWGYSPLDKITPANVARLKPVWVFAVDP